MGSGDSRRQALTLSHLGIGFLLIVVGSVYLGLKADERWGTSPWLVLLGFLGGFALGFYYLLSEVFGNNGASSNGGGDDDAGDAGGGP